MSDDSWKDVPREVVQARLELIRAETQGQIFDNQLAQSIAETSQMALRRERERNAWELAGPTYQRIFYFTDSISSGSVSEAIDTMSRWDYLDNQEGNERGYTMILCSPGGEVVSGFQFYSFLASLAQKRELTIIAAGMCASMATAIHQAASDGCRLIEPGTTYLLHELSAGTGGRLDTIQDTTEYFNKLNESLRNIYVKRANKDKAEIKAAVERRECYLTPEEVIEWGLADRIAYSNGGEPA